MFESDRLRFRALHEDDHALLHEWWSDPEIARFQYVNRIRLNQPDTNRSMFELWCKDGTNAAGFSIELKETGELAGSISLWGADSKDRDAELAILIGPKERWGQGLGTEAVRLMLDYGFREMNLHRIHLHVHGYNARAMRAYEKCGFQVEGRLREAFFRDGKWHDRLVMGILQREWLEQQ